MSYIEAIEKMFENFKSITTTKTVVGEPIQIGSKTVVPLIQALIGFGGGGGEGELKEGVIKKSKHGTGGSLSGFGGGMKVTPIALLIIDGDNVSFIRVTKGGGVFDKLVDQIPDILDRFTGKEEEKEE